MSGWDTMNKRGGGEVSWKKGSAWFLTFWLLVGKHEHQSNVTFDWRENIRGKCHQWETLKLYFEGISFPSTLENEFSNPWDTITVKALPWWLYNGRFKAMLSSPQWWSQNDVCFMFLTSWSCGCDCGRCGCCGCDCGRCGCCGGCCCHGPSSSYGYRYL